jgi:hypothetical protein
MRLMQKEAPKVAPRITAVDSESALFEVAGSPYRPFPRGGFDLERRFKDMAAKETDMQAVSVPPQTFLYDQDASLAGTFRAHPERRDRQAHQTIPGPLPRAGDPADAGAGGGGFTPYQAGRWVHGWHVRNEPKKTLPVSPEASLRRFYYDTIVHSRPQLESLVGWAGASHVLLGSDYPFDMGTLECVRQVRAAKISDADRATVLGGQAAAMLPGGSEARARGVH